jgi:hypothetical protein
MPPGQGFGVAFELIDAEEFGPQGLFVGREARLAAQVMPVPPAKLSD